MELLRVIKSRIIKSVKKQTNTDLGEIEMKIGLSAEEWLEGLDAGDVENIIAARIVKKWVEGC